MTGAMAGSSAIFYNNKSEKINVITVTINNKCNMKCPHCYLNYDGPDNMIDGKTIDSIISSKADHVAIVGKEPLFDKISVEITEKIISMCAEKGKTVSLVTNGTRLNHLSAAAVNALEWIDVSLDGGPLSYKQYRRGNFSHILDNVNKVMQKGKISIHALHTLSLDNIKNIDDMMSISKLFNWSKIIFSTFTPDNVTGRNFVSPLSLDEILSALKASSYFIDNNKSFLFIGSHSFKHDGIDSDSVNRCISEHDMDNKVIFIDNDPLLLGYIRVTYDGYCMTPYQSLVPSDYNNVGLPLRDYPSLDSAFRYLRAA